MALADADAKALDRLYRHLQKKQRRSVLKQPIQHLPQAVIVEMRGRNVTTQKVLHGFAFKKLTKQVQRRTDKPQPIENHRFQHLPWADVVQAMGFE